MTPRFHQEPDETAEPLDPGAFRERALSVLRERFPQHRFEPGNTCDLILHGEAQLSLRNLFLVYQKHHAEIERLDDFIAKTLSELIESRTEHEQPLSWPEAESKLMPQLMPAEFCEQAPVLFLPFIQQASIGIALDSETSYRYVLVEELEQWDKTAEEVLNRALTNLEERSQEMEMHAILGADRMVAVQTEDGFDAARILLPRFRELMISKLGEPFFASVPNRDFLVCWSGENSEGFRKSIAAQVRSDFCQQPHPLSPAILRCTSLRISVEDANSAE